MNIVEATYFANYDDYNGWDEVECQVDLDKMAVVSFGPVRRCRCFDGTDPMSVSETIEFADGSSLEAVKFDEYNDWVYNNSTDLLDAFDNGEMVLFDSGQLPAT